MKVFIILFLFSFSISAQSNFAIEIRGSRYTTYNQGELISSMIKTSSQSDGEYYVQSLFSNFRPTVHYSYSIGLLYRMNERSVLKFHTGYHENGFIFDVDKLDFFSIEQFINVESRYEYLQLVPSFTYELKKGRHRIPLDFGLSINIPTNPNKPFYLGSSHVNIDLRLSIGYAYLIYDNLTIGLNFVSSYAPFPYFLNSPSHNGTEKIEGNYQPYQFGFEATVKYDLPSNCKSDESMDELRED